MISAGWLGLLLLNGTLGTQAAIEILADRTPAALFGNGKRIIRPQFHNPDPHTSELNLRYRIYQASASTLMPLGEIQSWKNLTLTSNQTVVESFEVELPAIRGTTMFQIVWYDGEKKLGPTLIHAFPSELLKPLEALAGGKPIGLLDPDGRFKATLGPIPLHELKDAEDVTSTETGLILIAPMTAALRPAGLTEALKRKAAAGCAVVWIQPEALRQLATLPDAYVVNEGTGRIVVATATTVADLAESPGAQLNLVRLAELAVGKKQLELPHAP